MNRLLGVYGASGFGREVMPLLKQQNSNSNSRLVFIDDGYVASSLNGFPVVRFEEFLSLEYASKEVCIAIADFKVRRTLFEKIEANHIGHKSIYADNCLVLDEVSIAANSILCPFVTLTSNITIGKSFHANLYSYVGHDCEIGDFVTFAPGVKCNGNVRIENNVYVGTGAIIKQGRPGRPLVIGEGAVIGMGALVNKDVPPGAIVVATPTKPLARKGLGK